MKRRGFICILGGTAAGFWSRRRTIVVAMAALVLLPIEASDAGWLSDVFKSSPKRDKPPKHVTSPKRVILAKHTTLPKHHTTKLAALGPVALPPTALKPAATSCDPAKFRIVLDVGHTAESEGAISARNVAEFVFNLRLAQRIEEKLRAEGFAETRLLLTAGRPEPASSNASPPPTICTRISSCRSTMTPYPANCSRTGNSRAREAISATASADIPSSSPATIRTSRRASRSLN